MTLSKLESSRIYTRTTQNCLTYSCIYVYFILIQMPDENINAELPGETETPVLFGAITEPVVIMTQRGVTVPDY